MTEKQIYNTEKELTSQTFYNWIDCNKTKTQLTRKVKASKELRNETQKELSQWLDISLTKIKEIEKGTCKDFNAINNYINFYQQSLVEY